MIKISHERHIPKSNLKKLAALNRTTRPMSIAETRDGNMAGPGNFACNNAIISRVVLHWALSNCYERIGMDKRGF